MAKSGDALCSNGMQNGIDLTEAEDIKKRWQEYTEELYEKDLHDPDNHNCFVTQLESDILTSLVAQMVKCLPAIRETQFQSLGWEDLLEKEMATHSSIPAWRIPGMEEPGNLQSMGSQRVGHD